MTDVSTSPLKARGVDRLNLLAHLPRLAYAGPIGRHTYWRDHLPQSREGVYHLFDDNGQVVYVGKTCNPFQRFVAHREKSWWWNQVQHLNFYVIGCEQHSDEPCPRRALESLAFKWEAHAIAGLRPPGNTVGVGA